MLACRLLELNDPNPDPSAEEEDEEGAKKLPSLLVVSFTVAGGLNEEGAKLGKALVLGGWKLFSELVDGANPLNPANGFAASLGFEADEEVRSILPNGLGFGADREEVRSTLPNIDGFAAPEESLVLFVRGTILRLVARTSAEAR